MESGFLIWVVTESGILANRTSWGTIFFAVGSGSCFLIVGIVPCRFDSTHHFNMLVKKDIAASSAAGQDGKGGRTGVSSGRPNPGKPTELFNEREFCEHFFIPNGVSVQLVEGNPTITEKVMHNVIFFSKKQFNAGFRFPLPSLFKQFLHYTQIPSAYIHPNII